MNKTIVMKQDTELYRQYFVAAEETLAAGEKVVLSFGGSSMLPTLHPSDKLTFAPVSARQPQVGDIVLFRHAGMYKVHRVIDIHGGRFTMQGDNCYGVEHSVREDVLAVLVHVDRLGDVGSPQWEAVTRQALRRKRWKNFAIRWLGRKGRHQLRPVYLFALFFLMWAPLNGVGVVLDNYIFGLRADHLLHATVFIPLTFYFMDLSRHRWLVWLMGIALALLCESVQYVLPFRKFDVNDMAANVLGVSLGWAVILFALRAIRRRRQCPARVKRGGCR